MCLFQQTSNLCTKSQVSRPHRSEDILISRTYSATDAQTNKLTVLNQKVQDQSETYLSTKFQTSKSFRSKVIVLTKNCADGLMKGRTDERTDGSAPRVFFPVRPTGSHHNKFQVGSYDRSGDIQEFAGERTHRRTNINIFFVIQKC